MNRILLTFILVIFVTKLHCQNIKLFEYKNPNLYKGKAIVFTKKYSHHNHYLSLLSLFTPSKDEIVKAENILFEKYNEDLAFTGWAKESSVKKKYWHYNRQYLGYINEKNEKSIIINLLNFKSKRKSKRYYDGWEKSFFSGYGKFYEENTIRFRVNIDTEKLYLKLY